MVPSIIYKFAWNYKNLFVILILSSKPDFLSNV
jgi:hypothetical protein